MNFAMGDGGASSNVKKLHRRHTAYQIQQLEEFFKECPNPDERQRHQLSENLGLEARQVKFWFQNKRTQTKALHARADNNALRAENEMMRYENLAIREAMKNVICPSCGGQPLADEDHELQKLQQENDQLKKEASSFLQVSSALNTSSDIQSYKKWLTRMQFHGFQHKRLSNLISSCTGKLISQIQLELQAGSSADYPSRIASSGDGVDVDVSQMENALLSEAANSAMEELLKLLRVNEPLWVKSSSSDGRLILHRQSYQNIVPQAQTNHFKTCSARIESSKDSRIVNMRGIELVDIFLDADKWVDFFPSIVTQATTIKEVLSGMLGSRNGALQLMHAEIHVVSPMVPPRALYFLRHCLQVHAGIWVIVDVSVDFPEGDDHFYPCRCWKFPSGCMIREAPYGTCQVIWVEHVEVEDRTPIPEIYRDLICNNTAYGAERWVVTLERMCERYAYSFVETLPSYDNSGVISLPQGRRSTIDLAHRMIKKFCGVLKMNDSPQQVNGVHVSIRKNREAGEPNGMAVIAASSIWLPLPWQAVFDFISDHKRRLEWDILTCGNPVHKITQIATGTDFGNCISIIQPFIPTESNTLILQESCRDSLGSMVVYAPLDVPGLNVAFKGEDSSNVPILPSGFIITDANGRAGSLLTLAFQILVSGSAAASSPQLPLESVPPVHSLITSTIQKIKAALSCLNVD